ncbi:MAG TPA: TolC family protein [bacterium]|nr:TolC family protein [bacterium]
MKKIPTLLLLLLAAAGSARGAQDTLTWDQALKEAAQNNRDLLAAEQTVKALEDAHQAALGQFFPQISLGASWGRGGTGGLNDALDSPAYHQNSNLSLNLHQAIFSGFSDIASVDASNARLDQARAELDQARAQVSHDLKDAFYQLLFAQKQIELLQQILARDKANQDLVQMNFDGGTDNKGSLLQAQAAVAQDQFSVDQAQRALRVDERQLDQVLGRSPMADLSVIGDFETPTLPDAAPDFLKLTLLTPAHREAVAQLGLADSSYVSDRGAFLPTLSADASLSRGGWNFSNDTPAWSAGLNLSLPLFTGGQDLFNFKSAEESKLGVKDQLESSDMKTEQSLENAYAAFEDAVGEIQVQQVQVEAAQTQEEIAKAEYLNGLLIFQNWNQIESALTNQQKQQLNAMLTIKTAEAAWQLAEGKGDIP